MQKPSEVIKQKLEKAGGKTCCPMLKGIREMEQHIVGN